MALTPIKPKVEILEIEKPDTDVIEVIEQGPQGVGGVSSVNGQTGDVTLVFGDAFGEFTEGNDARISKIAPDAIDMRVLSGGGGTVGSINMTVVDGISGNINTSDGGGDGSGGYINTSASSSGKFGGSINTSGGASALGGSINTSNGGGSLDTTGTGDIGLGSYGTRTNLVGSATANRSISFPDNSGVVALTTDVLPVFVDVKNTSGGQLTAGTPIYATGTVGNTSVMEIAAARADDATKIATAILNQSLSQNGTGKATIIGQLINIDTSLMAKGDIYLAPTGGLTNTAPTDKSHKVQWLGTVERVNANNGIVWVNVTGPNPIIPAFKIYKVSSTPSSPSEGDIYYNSTDKHFYGYNGTTWKQLDN